MIQGHKSCRIVFGPPGTGKTSWALAHVEKLLTDGVPPASIAFLAFTKKASQEAKTRAIKKFEIPDKQFQWFRTIHSFAFQRLGLKRSDVLGWRDMDELALYAGVEIRGTVWTEDGVVAGGSGGDKLLFLDNLARMRRVPLKQVWESDDHDIDWGALEQFSKAYLKFRRERGLFDYTDMLESFLESRVSSPELHTLFVDESQDCSTLQWQAIAQIAKRARHVILAGDPDQCSIAGTQVSIEGGRTISVEELKPNEHRLVTFQMHCHQFVGDRKGSAFEIESRPFTGEVCRLSAGQASTVTTLNHKHLVRWSSGNEAKYAVYLMQSSTRYRVGWCQLMYKNKGKVGFTERCRTERAEYGWILKVFDDKAEASAYESVVAARYGMPMVMFREKGPSAPLYLQHTIDSIFEQLGDIREAAEECLTDHERHPQFPFYAAGEPNYGCKTFQCFGYNLLPDVMSVPVRNGVRPKWERIDVRREHYNGQVYGLRVPKYHTYIADGIATHNCIFRWSGAEAEGMMRAEGRRIPLEQSHRIPASVHSLAMQIRQRIPGATTNVFHPRPEPGKVEYLGEPEMADLGSGTWLLLARHVHMLRRLERVCEQQGVAYESRGKRLIDSPSLRAVMTWETLRSGKSVDRHDALEMAAYLPQSSSDCKVLRGLKAVSVTAKMLHSGNEMPVWHQALVNMPEADRAYFLSARRRGEKLLGEPRVRISTIHGSKGSEADNVLLMTDISKASFENMNNHPEDEHRTVYVGITRAKQNLFVVRPQTELFYDV